MTEIGDLRVRYSVRVRSETRSTIGERSVAYVEKFQAWGEMPREGIGQVADDPSFRRSEASYRLRFRYRPGFAIGDQLVDLSSGRTLYVTSASPADRLRQYVQISASESPVTP